MKHQFYYIVRKGEKLGKAELLKSCSTSTGYLVTLFKLEDKVLPYIVAVKRGNDTIEFKRLFKGAFSYYLNMICCYA